MDISKTCKCLKNQPNRLAKSAIKIEHCKINFNVICLKIQIHNMLTQQHFKVQLKKFQKS